jgi:hypothetical protein
MLIATITALIIIFGSGLEFYLTDLKKPVKEYVQDKARQEIIIDAGKTLSKELKELEKQVDENFQALVEVHSQYHSTAADYNEVTVRLRANQKESSRLILDTRDVMHNQMTKEEWEAVFQSSEKQK